uniref:G-protein coupled receptors family 1 profile domain-containing protein n=1 Tax=Arion vulgaris TaxID=1028688 RepID=A0A0B6Z7D2_9EUPU
MWKQNHINGTESFNNSTTHGEDIYNDTTNPRLINGLVVLVLLILNLSGNSLVFYIYRFRVKTSVFSFFVTTLAALDIITALTTMLLDVIIKVRPLDENILDLYSLCKITHFQVYAHSLISGCLLTLIAHQRYRKICHPLKPSLKMKTAKCALVIMVLCCVLLSTGSLIINGPKDVQVKIGHHSVNVTICRYDKKYEGKYQILFSTMLTVAFSLVLCLTIIFYALVAKSLQKFERRNSRTSTSSPTSTEVDNLNFRDDSAERRKYQQQSNQARMSTMSINGGSERISTQMYRVFAIITAVFVISYLPHLVILILTKTMDLDNKVLTYTQRIFLELAYNCPYISTISNPVVYGLRSTEFREHCKSIFTCSKWRRRRAYRQ